MSKQLKIGVIGMGFVGPAHMEGIRRLGHEVAAIADYDQALADEAAQRYRVKKAYGNWIDLVNNPEIDVVHVASPNAVHYIQSKAALEAGKHVVCEKPLAMNTTQSRELVALAREKKLVNAINFNIRYYPLVQEAHARVKSGALGERIYAIHGSYLQDWLLFDTDWNWRLETDVGGKLRAVSDIGSHWMDLVTFISGTQIKEVFADTATFIPVRRKPKKKIDTFGGKLETDAEYEEKAISTEDYATILFRFDNGARGVLTVSQVSSGRKNRLQFEIDGSESSIFWESEHPNELWLGHRPEPNQVIIKDPVLMQEESRRYASYPGGHAEGFPDTFKQLQSAVYGYILEGDFNRQADFPTFLDGHRTLAVDEAIFESARQGKWVEVAY